MHNKILTLLPLNKWTTSLQIKVKVNQHTYKLFSQSRAGVCSELKFPSVCLRVCLYPSMWEFNCVVVLKDSSKSHTAALRARMCVWARVCVRNLPQLDTSTQSLSEHLQHSNITDANGLNSAWIAHSPLPPLSLSLSLSLSVEVTALTHVGLFSTKPCIHFTKQNKEVNIIREWTDNRRNTSVLRHIMIFVSFWWPLPLPSKKNKRVPDLLNGAN